MTDSLYQRLGEMRLPTKATDVSDADLALDPLDHARDALLGLLAAAINFELAPAWSKVVAVVPQLAGKSPVADTWKGPPTPELMLQRMADFPILFVSRDGDGVYEDHSLARRQLRQSWEIHYALLALSTGDFRKVQDILTRVGQVIDATIERKGHPAYQSGSAVLYTAGFASLVLQRVRKGQAKFADTNKETPTYWMLSATLESTEVVQPLDGTASDWTGTGFAISSGNADGLIQPFIQFDSEMYRPPLGPWAPDSTDGATLTDSGDTLVTPGGDTLLNA